MEVIGFDSFEDMTKHISDATRAAIDMMTPAQRKLCDGNEHWAFCLDGISSDNTELAIVHVKSRKQILDGEYPDEASLWFDEYGVASRGFLPCETWDAYYSPPPNEPDLHDRHASTLMEITEDEFNVMYEGKCDLAQLAEQPEMIRLFLAFIALYGDRT